MRKLLLLLVCSAPLLAQEQSIDGLFEPDNQDIVADQTFDINSVTVSPASAHGSLLGTSALVSGQRSGALHTSGYYDLVGTLLLDARPYPQVRAHGTLVTEVDGTTVKTPSFSELFLDYTLFDWAQLRAGKQALAWGVGRLFNPGNLASDVSDGIAAKAIVPVWGQSVSGFVLVLKNQVEDVNDPSWTELNYAVRTDVNWEGWGLGAAARGRPGTNREWEERAATLSLKTSLFGLEWFGEAVWQKEWDAVAGFFWENTDWNTVLQAEITRDKRGFGFRWRQGAWEWILRSESSTDGSGLLVPAGRWKVDKALTITMGVPWVYGTGGDYVDNNKDPGRRRLAMGLTADLSAEF